MPIIQKVLSVAISAFFCWIFLGTGIRCHKQGKYESGAIGFVLAYILALYIFRIIVLMR